MASVALQLLRPFVTKNILKLLRHYSPDVEDSGYTRSNQGAVLARGTDKLSKSSALAGNRPPADEAMRSRQLDLGRRLQ